MAENPHSNRRVWDPLVRIGHWLLAVSIALVWFTKEGGGVWHEWIGYVSLALVALRVSGDDGVALRTFQPVPPFSSNNMALCRQLVQGRKIRYIGHNPLAVDGHGVAGQHCACRTERWLYTNNAYWARVARRSARSVCSFTLVLIALHLAA